MPPIELIWEVAGGTVVLCSVSVWLHLRRIHRWEAILKSPVREALKKIPPKSKFLKKYPDLEKSLTSKTSSQTSFKTLEEVLDQTLGSKEQPVLAVQLFEFFAKEQSLREKIKKSLQHSDEPVALGHEVSGHEVSGHEVSGLIRADEEKIKNIVTLPAYQSDPTLPVDAVATSVLSNLVKAVRGQKPMKTALEHAVLDSFGASGGFAGAKAAAIAAISVTPWLAVGLKPYWIPIAMVIGAAIGSFAGRKIAHRVKERKFYATQKHLKQIAKDFKQELLLRTPEMQLELENDLVHRQVALKRVPSTSIFKRMIYFVYPDLLTIWVQLSTKKIATERKLFRKNWKRLRQKIKKLRFDDLDRLITQLNAKSLASYPGLMELRSQYKETDAPETESVLEKAKTSKS